jgi:hypothetical protein
MVKTPRVAQTTRIFKWMDRTNWQKSLFRLMLIVQCMYFIAVFLPIATNVAATAQQDLNLVRFLPAGLFVFGIAQFLWGLKPRRLLVMGLLAEMLFCFIIVLLFVKNRTVLTHITPHISLLLLSISIIYRYSDGKGYKFSNKIIPFILSATMFSYAVGVLQHLDEGLVSRFGTEWAEILSMLLSFSFFWVAGYLLHNHTKPTVVFLCLVPQFFYSISVCFYFVNYPAGLSIIRPITHLTLSIFLFMLTAARAQEQQHGFIVRTD